MELEGLKRGLAKLEQSNNHVDCLITDRHPMVKKYMRVHQPDVTHFFDIWHVAKGMHIQSSNKNVLILLGNSTIEVKRETF